MFVTLMPCKLSSWNRRDEEGEDAAWASVIGFNTLYLFYEIFLYVSRRGARAEECNPGDEWRVRLQC